jgi:hypothetical protein
MRARGVAVAGAWVLVAIWWLLVAIRWLSVAFGGIVFVALSFVFSDLLGSSMYFLFSGVFARSWWADSV